MKLGLPREQAAAAPFGAAAIWQLGGGYRLVEQALIGAALISAIAFVLAVALAPKRRPSP